MIETTTATRRQQDQTNVVKTIRTILQAINRLTDPRPARELSARLRRGVDR